MNAPLKTISFSQGINMALDEAMAADPNVFVLGEDVADEQGGGVFKATLGLSAKYGASRVRSTPISEQAIIGAAVGAAITGMRPVAEIMFMNFLTVCMDQIVNHAAKLRFMSGGLTSVPLTIRCGTGAGVGFGGQHSDMLEAWFAHVPGLKVLQPSTPHDAKGMLLAAIDDPNPVLIFEHKLLYKTKGHVPEEAYRVPIGQAAIRREGADITIVGSSIMALKAQAAAERLATEGISAEVIDLRSIRPIDFSTIAESVRKTHRLLVVYEGVKTMGIGAEISAMIAESEVFDFLDAPIIRLGGADVPIPYNPVLEKAAVPQEDDIVTAAANLVRRGEA